MLDIAEFSVNIVAQHSMHILSNSGLTLDANQQPGAVELLC
jgi:hypothetical protein